jgi:hypothetical protein
MIYEPKADIYTILNAIEGVNVYQSRPDVIAEFPSLTFYIGSNIPEYELEKEIAYQDIEVVIDIYAKTSKESGSLLASLEDTMLENNWRLIYNADVPENDVSHITTRFNLVE